MKTRNELYDDGWNACREGQGRDANPYQIYTSDYTHWNDGWYDMMDCLLKNEPRGMWQAFDKEQ